VAIGVYPAPLYALLPFDVSYVPYTTTHVITQLQLLMFSALAFTVMMRTGMYPPELNSVNLDSDVVYRKYIPLFILNAAGLTSRLWTAQTTFWSDRINTILGKFYNSHGPEGRIAKVWPTGAMVLAISAFLGATLIINYFS
jgi:multicomponent Na+:H+ antiporter subunit D